MTIVTEMMCPRTKSILTIGLAVLFSGCREQSVDPLPSWREGNAKEAIMNFVEKVTEQGGNFVQPDERIAVFDNDGTLWSEKPVYVQLAFAIDQVRELADEHPEWRTTEPFKSVLEDDMPALLAAGTDGLLEIVMATHSGMTTEEFEEIVAGWVETSLHPTTGLRYTEMVYKPMLELLQYLRNNDFKVFIVSGGGVEFMRPWVQTVYGIPPERVVGSSIKTRYVKRNGEPAIERLPQIDFIDDKAGKPVAINRHIGKRPLAAFGNSDGDLQMLQWTTAGAGTRFGLLVRHTDGEREWKYDRESHVGRLDKALDEADEKDWVVVDMKEDWIVVYPEPDRER